MEIDVPQHPALSRRNFMIGTAGLTLGVATSTSLLASVPVSGGAALGSELPPGRAFNAYVTLGDDGRIFIMAPATEMGQGSLTSLPLIVADEMDASWDSVVIVPAPASDRLYGNPAFYGLQMTAGSFSVAGYYASLRKFGAQVRQVLLANAARRWGVDQAQLTTEPGFVIDTASKRRMSYKEIAGFMQVPDTAPEVSPAQMKDPSKFHLIGKRGIERVDVASKVDGSCQYSIDVQVPGMLYGAIARAPVEGARPVRVDDSLAKQVPGVVKIIELPYGVGVVADKPWSAFAARDALRVEWDRSSPAWNFSSEEGAKNYLASARNLSLKGTPWGKKGDVFQAMEGATRVFSREYLSEFAYHAQMEPLNVVAAVSEDGSRCEVWAGTQSQSMMVAAVAGALKIPEEKVTYHIMLMGGGFGRRNQRDQEFVVDGVLLSKAVGRAVKCIWTREDDIKNGRFHPMSANFLQAGIDGSGNIVAWRHRKASDGILPFIDPLRYKRMGFDLISIAGADLQTYDVPNSLAEHLMQDSGIRTSALRGIGFAPNTFAMEAFIDELSEELKVDAVELRLRLLGKAPRAVHVIRDVLARSDFRRKRAGRGLGLAYMNYSGTEVAMVIEISVKNSGEIVPHNVWATLDCGVAIQPENIIAQSEGAIVYGLGLALSEQLTIKGGVAQHSNFTDYKVPRMREIPRMHCKVVPSDGPPKGVGQMTTPLVAPAIAAAFHRLKGKRLRHMPFVPSRVATLLAEK